MSQDYYKTLGVDKSAPQADIKKAYRKLALKYHPDKTKGDKELEDKFKKIAEAYAVIGEPDKRQVYDMARQYHAQGAAASGSRRGFNSGPFNAGGFGAFNADDLFGDISRVFDDLFKGMFWTDPNFGTPRPRTASINIKDQMRFVGTVDLVGKVSDQAKNAAAALSAQIKKGDTELATACLREIPAYNLNRSPSLVKALLGTVPESCKQKFLPELIGLLNKYYATPEGVFVEAKLNLDSFLETDPSLAKPILDSLEPEALVKLSSSVKTTLEKTLPKQFYRSISLAYLDDVGHNNLKERSDKAVEKLKEMASKDRTLLFCYVEHASVEALEKVPEFKEFILTPVNTEKNVSSIMQHVGKKREEPEYERELTEVAERADRILGKLMHFDESVAVRCCEGIPADRIESSKLNDKLFKHAPEAYMKTMAALYVRKLAEAGQNQFGGDSEQKAGIGLKAMSDWVRTTPGAGSIVQKAFQDQFDKKIPKPIRERYKWFFDEVKNAAFSNSRVGRVARRFGLALTLH